MKAMSSLERCQAVMNGQLPDRVPVVPQSFLLACETAGYKIGQINNNAKLLTQSHIICQEKYAYDGCIIDVDDASLAEACGAEVIYREDGVAAVDESKPVLKNLRDFEDLKLPDPLKDGRLPVWLETTERLVDAIGDYVFVMGRADQGPFSLACLLRGMEQFMMDLVLADPKDIQDLLDWCSEACIRFAKAQKDAGAHATSMGDASAGPNLISPEFYRNFALEPEKKVVKAVQDYGIPYSVHICGDASRILQDMASIHSKIIEVDWKVDMGTAREIFSDDTILVGNINPSDPLVIGTAQQVDAQAKKIIESTKGRGLFLSSGCAMGPNTNVDNFKAMIEASKKYGTYEHLLKL